MTIMTTAFKKYNNNCNCKMYAITQCIKDTFNSTSRYLDNLSDIGSRYSRENQPYQILQLDKAILLCRRAPPLTFHGCQIVHWDKECNEVLSSKKNVFALRKMHGFYGNR